MSSSELAANLRDFITIGGNLLTVAGFVGAGLLGFWFGRQQGDAGRVLELQSEVENQRRKLESYRSQVNRHFEKTATLFTGMARSYRDLYEHLVDSYDRLGEGPSQQFLPRRASALLELSREEQRRAIPSTARPTQPEAKPEPKPAAAAQQPAKPQPESKPQPSPAVQAQAKPQAKPQQKPAAAAKAPDPRGATAFKPEQQAAKPAASAARPAAAKPAAPAAKQPAAASARAAQKPGTAGKPDPRGATAFKPEAQKQSAKPQPARPAAAKPAPRPAAAPKPAVAQASRPAQRSTMTFRPTGKPGTIPGATGVLKEPGQPDRIRVKGAKGRRK